MGLGVRAEAEEAPGKSSEDEEAFVDEELGDTMSMEEVDEAFETLRMRRPRDVTRNALAESRACCLSLEGPATGPREVSILRWEGYIDVRPLEKYETR